VSVFSTAKVLAAHSAARPDACIRPTGSHHSKLTIADKSSMETTAFTMYQSEPGITTVRAVTSVGSCFSASNNSTYVQQSGHPGRKGGSDVTGRQVQGSQPV
jgi:hypothetical protein